MKYLWTMSATSAVTASLCGAVVFAFPEAVYEESFAQYAHARELTTRADEDASPAPFVAIGDSRMKAAVLPAAFGPGAVSLSMAGASPIELDVTVARYLRTHPAPARAVVGFAPVHFHSPFLFWERAIKFGYLDDAEVREVFREAEALGDESLGGPWRAELDYAMHRLNLLHLYLPELRAASLHPRSGAYTESLAALRRGRGHMYFGKAERAGGPGYEVAHEAFHGAPIYARYLHRLLDRLVRAGTEVRYQAMPVNARTAASIRPDYLAAYERFMAEIARAHPAVRFDARLPVLPDDHFGDDDHVNARGAERVTRALREGDELPHAR